MNFIDRVVSDLLTKEIDLKNLTLVLPGRRPIVFFKESFLKQGYVGFLPNFITIEELVFNTSSYQEIPSLVMWIEAYKIHKEHINPSDTFDEFLKWAPTLLNDFNEIDGYADEPKLVLEYLSSIDRIEDWGEELGLDDEAKAGRLYYKNIKFWENNSKFYDLLQRGLEANGLGTKGMLVHSAIQNIRQETKFDSSKYYAFAGFNAMTPREEDLMKAIASYGKSYFYWNVDGYYINDEVQESGVFLRQYQQWKENNQFNWVESLYTEEKNITVVGASQGIPQAKYAMEVLQSIPKEEYSNTAIVLCDEKALPIMLDSISQEVEKLNITMGYPLKQSTLSELFQSIFELREGYEEADNSSFYMPVVEKVLNSYVSTDFRKEVVSFLDYTKKRNIVFISPKSLAEHLNRFELSFIFQKDIAPLEMIKGLRDFSLVQFRKFSKEEAVLKESYLRFYELFSVFYTQLIGAESIVGNYKTLLQVFNGLLNNEKLAFIGEPLEGLQLMGLLETRLLGFKNVIMLDVNEGVMPAGRSEKTFIPFDVQREYKLNTFLENDAIYAYHFYRLIQYAENVHLVHNNFSEGLTSGEKSRFIAQLEMEYPKANITHKTANYSSSFIESKEFQIIKSKEVLVRLSEWLTKDISPTNLTAYLYSPVQFYLNKILGIREVELVEEDISLMSYGNIIHNSLEALYVPYIGKQLTNEMLINIKGKYLIEIDNYIATNMDKSLFATGYNYIQKHLAQKTVLGIIEKDIEDVSKGRVIILKNIEPLLESSINIEGVGEIKMKGYVDRWDSIDGVDRIIDYKTSRLGSLSFSDTKPFRDSSDFKFYVQLVFYAYMFLNEKLASEVQVGIWPFKTPKRGVSLLKMNKEDIFDLDKAKEMFVEVETLIKEILDPSVPFEG